MREKIGLILMLLCIIFNPVIAKASEISARDTHVVTVTAEVPAGYDRDITLLYREAGVDGWNCEFKLTSVNGYTVSRRLEEGEYQCMERKAADTILSSEEVFSLYSDTDLLVSVVDERSSSGIVQAEPVTMTTPVVRSYGWLMPAIAIVVALGVAVVLIVIVKK